MLGVTNLEKRIMKMNLNLDPRTKVLLILLCNILLFSYGDTIYLHLATTFAILLMIFAKKYDGAIKMSICYIGMYSISYLFSFTPKNIYDIWNIIMLPLIIFMPLYALSYLFFKTTEINEIITALQRLKANNSIIIPIIIMFRFVPTLRLELNGIKDAMKLKGINKNPIKLLENIYVPILFNAVKIGEDLNIAGQTRGLGLYKNSTETVNLKFSIYDLFVILVMIVLILLRRGVI